MKEIVEENDKIFYKKSSGVEYIKFKNLARFDEMITHCFTTRLGGVSTGDCASLNLGFNKNDIRENVEENFYRLAKAIGIDHRNIVFSNQVHGNRIWLAGENDRGKGISIESDILGFDGLITNTAGVAIVTFYADCVPVFFLDSKKRTIGLAHSGWKGTVKEISSEMVNKMREASDCKPEDIIAAIGPSIGKCCFEVGDEVYSEFTDKLPWSDSSCTRQEGGKWNIDLQDIIHKTLIRSGLARENISICGICTKCNKDVFFSYRGDNGRTGSLAAVMQLL